MASQKIQFLAGDLEEAIESRTVEGGSVHNEAREMARKYHAMCQCSLPFFHLREWRAIVASVVDLGDLGNPEDYRQGVANACRHGAIEEFQITEANDFLARWKRLSYASLVAALDLVERVEAAESKEETLYLPGEEWDARSSQA